MKKFIQKIFALLGYELRRRRSIWEDPYWVQQELLKKPHPVIFDVGANTGSVTRKYRALFPHASIYAFEPYPPAFGQLKKDLAGDRNIHVHDLAISNAPGRALLHVNAFSLTSSLLATHEKGSHYWGEGKLETKEKMEVEVTTIDAFCRQNGISSIDILKLDIQGHEFAALQGAREMLSSQSIAMIYMEMIMVPTYEGQHELHEYLHLLASLDYKLLDLYHPVKTRMQLIQADVLFLNRKTRDSLS